MQGGGARKVYPSQAECQLMLVRGQVEEDRSEDELVLMTGWPEASCLETAGRLWSCLRPLRKSATPPRTQSW